MSADMEAIAEYAGVSRTTVSRVLANKGRISEKTRQKVLQVARELDYLPNDVARALRAKKSATVGYCACALTSLDSQIILGAEQMARSNSYNILVNCSLLDPTHEIQNIEILREKRVDGVIVFPSHPETNAHYYQRLLDTGFPIVFVDRDMPGVEANSVMTDNYTGGLLAGRHLVSLGRRKMVFVSNFGQDRLATSISERLRGFRAALAEAGLSAPAVLGDDEPEHYATQALAKYIQSGNELDAVFAVNDSVAANVMFGLHHMGLRVPDDVSIVGYDGLDIQSWTTPRLTSIGQPAREIGREAMRLLLDSITAGESVRCPVRILLTPKLIIGGSCGSRQDCDL
jgi:DNA-binding LacI/PurR family transcriptional regulator